MSKATYHPLNEKPKNARNIVVAGCIIVVTLLSIGFFQSKSGSDFSVTKAKVVLSGESKASGTVIFEQGSSNGPVTVKGELTGLDASAARGFHIHQFGDLTGGCASAGPHFDPFGKTHGAPSDAIRHVGDLGNIKTNEDGTASFEFTDSLLTLNGPLSIIGRAVVLHAGTDDLGRGDDEESLKTGNAGGRAACGVIGLA
nr:CuZn superoxide dismutase 1 [Flammulina velutipes]